MSELKQNPVYVLIKAMRVYQWSKNLLLFAALLFSQQFLDPTQVGIVVQAFFAFSMVASATYLLNDIMDRKKDQLHPKKKKRPLASGAMSVPVAIVLLLALLGGGFTLAYSIRIEFLGIVMFYMALTIAYTLVLKHIIIVDVLAIATGFVARALAGAIAIDVLFSNWLVVCTLFLATFLSLCKRRHELTLLDENAEDHRKVLLQYTVHYLDQLILVMASGAIITYTIYTCSPEVVERLGTDKLYLTLPFVLYGVFRYIFTIHHHTGGDDPSRALLKDWPLGLCVVLWAGSCAFIMVYL